MNPYLYEKLIYLRRKKLEEGKTPEQLKWVIGDETIKALHSHYTLGDYLLEMVSPNPNIMGIAFDMVPGDHIALIEKDNFSGCGVRVTFNGMILICVRHKNAEQNLEEIKKALSALLGYELTAEIFNDQNGKIEFFRSTG